MGYMSFWSLVMLIFVVQKYKRHKNMQTCLLLVVLFSAGKMKCVTIVS